MKRLLWLDDLRDPENYITGKYSVSRAKNYEEFCKYLNSNGIPDVICFDHDLGEEKSGYDCAKFLVNYCRQHHCDIPEYDIQSSNPVGKENISGLLDSWHRFYVRNAGKK
ncbi:hypothetical protein HRI96_08020 [Treponema parvum]|uniref:Cyclic-phosphate processing Receiver domain-containing protein n=1 Tax=Treponema parvum TaxID=138851 RepID=A0A975F133_9SPIR|nr:cyclic-phosphate processing receiver domain-containing protein [Treponema parvum]QTQ12144.1 hypothetical protein HRI96_08020 [Treponema parvum]QTQ15866.1 hypothetical protein HXT04_03635 [Treponema parvum]